MQKKYRLLKRKDFKSVLNTRQRFITENFICHYKFNRNIGNIKVGIVIPKKKCKKAVDRNYLKRIFWYIHQFQKKEQLSNLMCVFFYKNDFFEKFFNTKAFSGQMISEVQNLYSKITRYSNENLK